jgi:hypothetical protein
MVYQDVGLPDDYVDSGPTTSTFFCLECKRHELAEVIQNLVFRTQTLTHSWMDGWIKEDGATSERRVGHLGLRSEVQFQSEVAPPSFIHPFIQ